jgi:tetratricopeptide (TPR) repeat protein
MADGESDSGLIGANVATGAILAAASREKADAFLEEQTRLARLQADDLSREDAVRHWSLRVRHISEVMKLTFELAMGFVVIAFLLLICTTVWKAAHDNSLVIEAFSVPPDLAARGLTGQAIAAQIQDSLSAMQAATVSARPESSYANNWGNDIKVQIPDTGVSVSEFYRLLVSWLGHQTHISGEVWRIGDQISITARVGEDAASTVAGKENNLATLLRQAAEAIYERTQPYRYSAYLEEQGPSHFSEVQKILKTLVTDGDLRERGWAWMGLSFVALLSGDPHRAIAELHKAAQINPNMAAAYYNLDSDEGLLGHDEAALAAAKNAVRLLNGSGDMSDRARPITLAIEEASIAFALNDLNSAIDYSRQAQELPDYSGEVETGRENEELALALLHDGTSERRITGDFPPAEPGVATAGRVLTKATADFGLGNWQAVIAHNQQVEQALRTNFGIVADTDIKNHWWPYVATAKAMTGDFKGAHALIDRTPTDCYTCVIERAIIDAAEKNWNGAAFWFAISVKEAPSIPLGYTQWGQMLLAKGDYDAAIGKFTVANQKSPHFADPLEMWGEALVAKNRSDLALAKFEAANKYAPNWGRLHLKWGEALLWSGDKAAAQKQFGIARTLDLTSAERADLDARG